MHVDSLTIGYILYETKVSLTSVEVIMDQHLRMEAHVTSVCQSAYHQIWNISRIRKCLTKESAKTLTNALVLSRLDSCNALLANLPKELITHLQRVQNAASRCIEGLRKRDSVSERSGV